MRAEPATLTCLRRLPTTGRQRGRQAPALSQREREANNWFFIEATKP